MDIEMYIEKIIFDNDSGGSSFPLNINRLNVMQIVNDIKSAIEKTVSRLNWKDTEEEDKFLKLLYKKFTPSFEGEVIRKKKIPGINTLFTNGVYFYSFSSQSHLKDVKNMELEIEKTQSLVTYYKLQADKYYEMLDPEIKSQLKKEEQDRLWNGTKIDSKKERT